MSTTSAPSKPAGPYDSMTPQQRAAERKAALKWGALVVAILGASFTVAMVMLYVSAIDPSFAVEPDYYDKAIHWDEQAAQYQVNAQLGWKIAVGTAPAATPGMRIVTAALTDRDGAPIEDAALGVVAFHNARSADRKGFPMTTAGGGVFTAEAPLQRAGIWEFRFTAVSPEHTFTDVQQVELPPMSDNRFPR
ncbi:MAG: FixH family protein [Phycisphaeraceae bacterium]|nr:FixH family protein [Phycisphaeraceae bacterium]